MFRLDGWVDDIEPLLRAASIGVQTSRSEGLSLSLLDQMMAGLPVVATAVGETATAVTHGVSGLLVPSGDDEALISALRRLILDRGLRLRLGAAARQRALNHYSQEAALDDALDFYGPEDRW